jgi:8-oxo-dGTP pyrophosphatase MutT (NUDIX family)
MNIKGYNIRVYGLLLNGKEEVLLSQEHRFGKHFTKFPGGGHELGEGIADCLKREFQEELGIEIHDLKHFYTTDFFQVSAFAEEDQLISIYYKVSSKQADSIQQNQSSLDIEDGDEHVFLWKKISELQESDVTYPIDKEVVRMMQSAN